MDERIFELKAKIKTSMRMSIDSALLSFDEDPQRVIDRMGEVRKMIDEYLELCKEG